jgi:hypothetical protein
MEFFLAPHALETLVYVLLSLWVLGAGLALLWSRHLPRLLGFLLSWIVTTAISWDAFFTWPPVQLFAHLIVTSLVYVALCKWRWDRRSSPCPVAQNGGPQ